MVTLSFFLVYIANLHGQSPGDFVTTWETTANNESITIPTFSGETYNYTVDWGDGSPLESGLTGDAMHFYASAGIYTVRISGDFPRIYFDDTNDKDKIITVEQWGSIAWTSMQRAFYGCSNLNVTATDAPDLSAVTDMSRMFSNALTLNADLNHWDVSAVTDMSFLFKDSRIFNSDLNNWDVSNVTTMASMFENADDFNGNIRNWDVGNVLTMEEMFRLARAFDQYIGDWNVGNVANFKRMFRNAIAFSQDIGGWDMRNAQNINAMIQQAVSFDQDLSSWDISNVTNASRFLQATTLSTTNYDRLLIGLHTDTSGVAGDGIDDIPVGIQFDGGLSTYCLSETQRTDLIDTYGWTIVDGGLDPEGCIPHLDFDGNNDHAGTPAFLGGYDEVTLMGWVKLDELRNADIFGQRNFRMFVTSSGNLGVSLQTDTGGYAITDTTQPLTANMWFHVATTFDAATNHLKLFIDGELIQEASTTGTKIDDSDIWNRFHRFEIGRNTENDNNYFMGDISEVRVYKVALTASQLQEQLYQQVETDGTNIRGTAIENTINSLRWEDLELYLKMEQYDPGVTQDDSNAGRFVSLYNMRSDQTLSAPIPFVANTSGTWTATTSWSNGAEWGITNPATIKPWSIVQITNNATITTNDNHEHFGLIIDAGAKLQANSNVSITNSGVLTLNGILDLQAESQLIQTTNSELDAASAGHIERDQQVNANSYAYNYLGSPVGAIGTVSNNTAYRLFDVLKDGTDNNNPLNINFDSNPFAADNGATSPITVSSYWIYGYANGTKDDYYHWNHIGELGTVSVGQGFTMKGAGTGNISDEQNLVFTGKPNNGLIQLPLGNGNEYLVGNPYPSAIDAVAFINDNSTTDGTIRFWESFAGTSHVTTDYQGGYALFNLSGGVSAISHPDVDQTGTGSKTPTRYIPVAQGFFIGDDDSNPVAGNITFENDQRVFATEQSSLSIFVRETQTGGPSEDQRAKIRLGFETPQGFHRQLLLTVDTNATEGLDWGYDAINNETHEDDLFWDVDSTSCIIQGISEIDASTKLPLMVSINNPGEVHFTIDDLMHIAPETSIYLKDTQQNVWHDLRTSDYDVWLDTGDYENRFQLVFSLEVLSVDSIIENDIAVVHLKQLNSLRLVNAEKYSISNVTMYNILGQPIKTWGALFSNGETDLQLPSFKAGTYILKITTASGEFTKKIVLTN